MEANEELLPFRFDLLGVPLLQKIIRISDPKTKQRLYKLAKINKFFYIALWKDKELLIEVIMKDNCAGLTMTQALHTKDETLIWAARKLVLSKNCKELTNSSKNSQLVGIVNGVLDGIKDMKPRSLKYSQNRIPFKPTIVCVKTHKLRTEHRSFLHNLFKSIGLRSEDVLRKDREYVKFYQCETGCYHAHRVREMTYGIVVYLINPL